MAIMTLPRTSPDRISNESILSKAFTSTLQTLSIILRPSDDYRPTLSELRKYVGEIYSIAWDHAIAQSKSSQSSSESSSLLNVIVYPQNLPNAAPEKWICRRPNLNAICSHNQIMGWSSDSMGGTGQIYYQERSTSTSTVGEKDGIVEGGLEAHVEAVNADRSIRGLNPVYAIPVIEDHCDNNDDDDSMMNVKNDPTIIFLEDEEKNDNNNNNAASSSSSNSSMEEDNNNNNGQQRDRDRGGGLLGGPALPPKSLFSSVAVGGTFDGLHYGHRKLLTLAISSVDPNSGRLLVGITADEMLRSKQYSELIPPLSERIEGVSNFLGQLAPGLKNRIRYVPIVDAYGPPGSKQKQKQQKNNNDNNNNNDDDYIENDFDALVLSHETLDTGRQLNEHRKKVLGLKPLMLLCTRRTEPFGMSSTALRQMKKKINNKQEEEEGGEERRRKKGQE